MKHRILIVDDEKNTREGLKWSLEDEDYAVETADSGERALEMFAAGEYDLIISDLKMPGIDGLELLRRVKSQDPSVQFVMLTAHGTIETAVEAMTLGAAHYQTKPVDLKELKVKCELALGGRSLHSGPLAASRQFTLALEDLPKIAVTASRGAVFYSWTVSGIPREEQPQVAVPDFSVSRRYLDFDGAQIDGEFVLGRPYIAELTFHSVRSLENVVVSDLLPGGLEIENPRLASRVGAPVTDTGGGEVQEETHVIRPQQVEMRDDRLLVFADLPVRDSTVAVYRYVVRAVAEGEFRLPPVAAECMYDPAMCAASSGGRIRVRLPSAH